MAKQVDANEDIDLALAQRSQDLDTVHCRRIRVHVIDLNARVEQIDDLEDEIRERVARKERVLVTTLTKRMAEDLTDHLLDDGLLQLVGRLELRHALLALFADR